MALISDHGIANSDITVVTVVFSSIAVLPAMLKTLPSEIKTIVVDNGPDDGVEALCLSQGITYIRNSNNVGFGEANNIAAQIINTPWILFINPDATLDSSCLKYLKNAVVKFPNAAGYAPLQKTAESSSWFKARSGLSRKKITLNNKASHTRTPFISGAVFLIRKNYFSAIGGFDPKIFLYFEDDDLCLRLSARYGDFILAHNALINHTAGQSTRGIAQLNNFKAFHYGHSEIYAIKKHYSFARAIIKISAYIITSFSLEIIFNNAYLQKRINRIKGMIFSLINH